MGLSVHLLGRPRITGDGRTTVPRGRKAWALLAYFLCTRRTVSRERLCTLLFSNADDPLGALRWNLAELRRLLGEVAAIAGDPVTIELPPGTYVDVRVLSSGTWLEALAVPGLGAELLEGLSFPGCAAFECWLLNERRHLQAASEAVLREAALVRLVTGEEESAVNLAARLVALNPLDETYQELLIRSLAVSGDRPAASRQLAACIALFRAELGVEPGPGVLRAVEATGSSFTAAPATGRQAARAQLEAGQAAIDAGALEAGLQCLRRATAEAHACGDFGLKGKALLALGSALVYSVSGRGEEGAAALHEVISLSTSTGRPALAASAHQVLAIIEILRGRHDRAAGLLATAAGLAGDDESARATGMLILGGSDIETGNFQAALRQLRGSLELAERCGDMRTAASSLAEVGRALFLLNELSDSQEALIRSLEIGQSMGMTSFLPFPESLLGLVEVASGDLDAAADYLEHAFALGCQIADPCHEGLAGMGLGVLAAHRDDREAAIRRFQDAIRRCIGSTDASVWVLGSALEALCSLAVAHRMPEGTKWIADLEALAARTGMRELLVRAHLHRHDLGDPAALEAAVLLAEEVDNPHLHDAVARRQGKRAPGLTPAAEEMPV